MSDSLTNHKKPKSNDELLEEAHNAYLEEVTESGIPLWICDLYGHSPYSFIPLPINDNNHSLQEEDNIHPDLPF